MALVVILQEDEDVISVYRNLKIFCETPPWIRKPEIPGSKPVRCGTLSTEFYIECYHQSIKCRTSPHAWMVGEGFLGQVRNL